MVQVGTGWRLYQPVPTCTAQEQTFEFRCSDCQIEFEKFQLRIFAHRHILQDRAVAGFRKLSKTKLISKQNALVQVTILYQPVPTCTKSFEFQFSFRFTNNSYCHEYACRLSLARGAWPSHGRLAPADLRNRGFRDSENYFDSDICRAGPAVGACPVWPPATPTHNAIGVDHPRMMYEQLQ